MQDSTIFTEPLFLEHDKAVVNTVLDIFSEQTGLPVGLYNRDGSYWSANRNLKYFSCLCDHLHNTRFAKFCEEDHLKRCANAKGLEIELCHMGLWNFAQPIIVNGLLYAALITGQRKINDNAKQKKSGEQFTKRLREIGATTKEKDKLNELFNEVAIVDYDSFHLNHVKKLSDINSNIFSIVLEREKEREDRIKKIQLFAHEVKMPLQGIVSEVSNLFDSINEYVEDCPSNDSDIFKEIFQIATKIHNRAKIVNNVIENVIGTTSDSTVRQKFKKHSIYKCLKDSIDVFDEMGKIKHIKIKLLGKFYPEIEMHFDDMRRALMNLIYNAYKYSFSGSNVIERYIEVAGEDHVDKFIIKIINYGTGILEEEITSGKIFENGYRGVLSKDRMRPGSGIGLNEAKKIIEQHNGSITIKSELKGEERCGDSESPPYVTTVIVTLPIYQPS